MAKVKFPLEEVLAINTVGAGGESAMSEKHPRYKKLKKRFKKNVLAMDYEKDLEKKKKKLKEAIKIPEDKKISEFQKRFKAFPRGPLNLKQIEAVAILYKEVNKYFDEIQSGPDSDERFLDLKALEELYI